MSEANRDEPERNKRFGGPSRSLNNQAGNEIGNEMPNEGPAHPADGLDEDERALRRLMHGAVQDLRPSDDVLAHLHQAVPARRARRRQIVVGAAAAVLLVGTAIPAFIHVAGAGGGVPNPAVAAGHGHHTQSSTGPSDGDEGGKKDNSLPSGGDSTTERGGEQHTPSGPDTDSHAGTTGGTGDPSGKSVKGMPMCGAEELGVTSASTRPAEADGTVYGTFRVSNVSSTQCAVSDAGTVNFKATGAADPARITVVDHTAGDAASGLPDPSQDTTGLVLAPSKAYEVKFAWVPTDTCPTTGASPGPTPSGGPGASGSTGEGLPDSAGVSPQLAYTAGSATSDGSVAVVHEAEPGVRPAQATIPNACAGTIYRTGVLDAP